MRDDRLQGILFNEAERIDLTRHSHQQRMLLKMLDAKHRMQGWLTRPQTLSPIAPDANKSFVVVRGGKYRLGDISDLAGRFKDSY